MSDPHGPSDRLAAKMLQGDQDRSAEAEWRHLDGTICGAGHDSLTDMCAEGHGPIMSQPVWAEIDRLRDLLRRWARAAGRCFGCNAEQGHRHAPSCELAAVLAGNDEMPPRP